MGKQTILNGASMKKLSIFFVSLITLGSAISYTAVAKPGKVEICHLTGNGDYIIIEVSERALDAHMAHGDLESINGLCGILPQ